MVTFPSDFVQLSFPGYYWNISEKALYTCKVSGILRPMKLQKSRWVRGRFYDEGYQISHNGQRRGLTLKYLMNLPVPTTQQTFPRV